MSASPSFPTTQLTLIRRIADASDHEGWQLFYRRYGDVLRRWASRWGLQEVDQEDLVQNVLLELTRCVQNYSPSGRFRGWLKTVARRAWYDYTQRRKSLSPDHLTSDFEAFIRSSEAAETFLDALEAEANAELVEVASEKVRQQVSENAWRSFEMMYLQGQSGDTVAGYLGIQTGSVYVSACRVKRRLRDEVARLNEDELA
ncbi:MAG: sigma-70 family RNA polymerase sigma factor [Planctomycetota bacterium]